MVRVPSSQKYNFIQCLPRMAWGPRNLYNLMRRCRDDPPAFIRPPPGQTLFAQQWACKRYTRAYHGDWIGEKRFRKDYLPSALPPIVGPGGAKVPITSMMFIEVEKRLDVLVFRSCFASSVYEARNLVLHGHLRLNGETFRDPNHRLQPGDMFSVEPTEVPLLVRPRSSPPPAPPRSKGPKRGQESQPPIPPAEPPKLPEGVLPFRLPEFSAPFLFIPPYLQPNFATCSVVYLRHPTARPGWSEIPTPYDADGEVMRLAWSFYSPIANQKRKRRRH